MEGTRISTKRTLRSRIIRRISLSPNSPNAWKAETMGAATGLTATIDILDQKTDDSLRQGIQNVIDSYHHDWDVLAELCQNSVDAFREKTPPNGEISVRIDRG